MVPDTTRRRWWNATRDGALLHDVSASLVVFLVALPLCLAIAVASGVPPALGLATGIVGGLVVGLLQGSPYQVSGPAAGLTVIVAGLVGKFGIGRFGLVVLAAGCIQLVAGFLGGGRWFRAVPPAVVHGMLGGIGVLIVAGQVHVMIDDRPRESGLGNLLGVPGAVTKILDSGGDVAHDHTAAALIGLVTMASLLLWPRLRPRRLRSVPAPLVGVAVGATLARAFGLQIAVVSLPTGGIFSALQVPTAARLGQLADPSLWLAALGLAVVASTETLLSTLAVDRMHHGPRADVNRELRAQGIGNAVCGILGALPMTAVIVRSSANVQAGARTRRATMFHGAWILVLVAFFPSVLRLVPLSSLAAVLVSTGAKLIDLAAVRDLRRHGRAEVTIYLATVVAIVATDLLKGVLIGLAVAVANVLWSLSRLEVELEHDTTHPRSFLHLRGSATFLRLPHIAEALARVPAGHELHVRLDDVGHLDHATVELLRSWERHHRAGGGHAVIDWNELDLRSRPRPEADILSP